MAERSEGSIGFTLTDEMSAGLEHIATQLEGLTRRFEFVQKSISDIAVKAKPAADEHARSLRNVEEAYHGLGEQLRESMLDQARGIGELVGASFGMERSFGTASKSAATLALNLGRGSGVGGAAAIATVGMAGAAFGALKLAETLVHAYERQKTFNIELGERTSRVAEIWRAAGRGMGESAEVMDRSLQRMFKQLRDFGYYGTASSLWEGLIEHGSEGAEIARKIAQAAAQGATLQQQALIYYRETRTKSEQWRREEADRNQTTLRYQDEMYERLRRNEQLRNDPAWIKALEQREAAESKLSHAYEHLEETWTKKFEPGWMRVQATFTRGLAGMTDAVTLVVDLFGLLPQLPPWMQWLLATSPLSIATGQSPLFDYFSGSSQGATPGQGLSPIARGGLIDLNVTKSVPTERIRGTQETTTQQFVPATQGRQFGGTAEAGMSYMVGERGPELFVPRTSGNVLAAAAGGSGLVLQEISQSERESNVYLSEMRDVLAWMRDQIERGRDTDGGGGGGAPGGFAPGGGGGRTGPGGGGRGGADSSTPSSSNPQGGNDSSPQAGAGGAGVLYDPVTGTSIGGGVGGHSGSMGAGRHQGVDIMAPLGAPLYAASDGVITKIGKDNFGQPTITIKHADGTYSRYLHVLKPGVSVGDTVKGGQTIGSSGTANGTPHLHFERWRGEPGRGQIIDPIREFGWDRKSALPQGGQVARGSPQQPPAVTPAAAPTGSSGWSAATPYQYTDESHRSWYGNFDYEKGLTNVPLRPGDRDRPSDTSSSYGETPIRPGSQTWSDYIGAQIARAARSGKGYIEFDNSDYAWKRDPNAVRAAYAQANAAGLKVLLKNPNEDILREFGGRAAGAVFEHGAMSPEQFAATRTRLGLPNLQASFVRYGQNQRAEFEALKQQIKNIPGTSTQWTQGEYKGEPSIYRSPAGTARDAVPTSLWPDPPEVGSAGGLYPGWEPGKGQQQVGVSTGVATVDEAIGDKPDSDVHVNIKIKNKPAEAKVTSEGDVKEEKTETTNEVNTSSSTSSAPANHSATGGEE